MSPHESHMSPPARCTSASKVERVLIVNHFNVGPTYIEHRFTGQCGGRSGVPSGAPIGMSTTSVK